jgi:hypothetical protein
MDEDEDEDENDEEAKSGGSEGPGFGEFRGVRHNQQATAATTSKTALLEI